MPRPPRPYPRAEIQARALERFEAGCTKKALKDMPGFPSRATLWRWERADPAFARQVAAARAWGRGVRREAFNRAQLYEPARAEAFLLAVRRGDAVRDLVRRPEWPNREALNLWKRMRPDFAAELVKSIRFARTCGYRRRPFDPLTAQRMVNRVAAGETLRGVWKDPVMPGEKIVRRWQRQRPDFAADLKAASRTAQRRRLTTRPRCTPELTSAIAAHIRRGGALRSAADRVRGAPCYQTLYSWMDRLPDFRTAIEAAQEERDDRLMDRALMIAEQVTPESVATDAPKLAAIRLRAGQLKVMRRARERER